MVSWKYRTATLEGNSINFSENSNILRQLREKFAKGQK